MTGSAASPLSSRTLPRVPLRHVLAGVDGSRADVVVTRCAARLLEPDGTLELISISCERGTGLSAQASLSRAHALHALNQAEHVAQELGVDATVHQLNASDDTRPLLEAAAGRDLLVVGFHGGTRFGGILLGRVATAAVHAAPCPVLIARPTDRPFPGPIVLGDDGSSASDSAAGACAAIAERFRVPVTIVMLDGAARTDRAAARLDSLHAAGIDAVLVDERGHAHTALPRVAASVNAGLLIVGTHAHRGPRAIASVAERVAHSAHCSVLVARPRSQ